MRAPCTYTLLRACSPDRPPRVGGEAQLRLPIATSGLHARSHDSDGRVGPEPRHVRRRGVARVADAWMSDYAIPERGVAPKSRSGRTSWTPPPRSSLTTCHDPPSTDARGRHLAKPGQEISRVPPVSPIRTDPHEYGRGVRGPAQGSRVAARPVEIRFLTGDTAIVVSDDGIIFPGQDAVARERLVRDRGAGQARWRLAHRLLPQQPRQLGCRLPGMGCSLPGSGPGARIRAFRAATALARS
jgi:hypothetical protein